MAKTNEEVPPPILEEDPIIHADVTELESAAMVTVYSLVAYGIVIVGVLGGIVYFLFKDKLFAKKKKKLPDVDDMTTSNTVGLGDVAYLAKVLNPDSSHYDVLMAVASTPENIAYGLKNYRNVHKMREKRIQEDKEEAKAPKPKQATASDSMFNLDDDGWADDGDEDDEKAKAAAKAEEEKKKAREDLKKAVGKEKIKMEGIDDGVLGQKWVENVLGSKKIWPPTELGILNGTKVDYEGKKVSPMDHPGLRRNLCMITGRLNSLVLNGHPDLLEASSKQNIDQTYFRGSMEFRGRCAMLLEAALRTAVACRNFKLAKTVVETVAMFKIGTPKVDNVDWFNGVMKQQFNALPRMQIDNPTIECQGEKEMVTGDVLAIVVEMTRLHAEPFTRQKIAMFQKQGIPPQVALQSYREGWWFLARAERLDGKTPAETLELKTDGILKEVNVEDLAKYHKATFDERLVTAWPMIIQNVAQKSGKVKIQCMAPSVPGKYRFSVQIKSQDFLGADQEFSVEADILDASTVVRKPKETKTEGEKKPEDPKAKKDV